MMTSYQEAVDLLQNAKTYQDVFGYPLGDSWVFLSKKKYKELSLLLHPDKGGDHALFVQLANFYRQAQTATVDVLSSKKHRYTIKSYTQADFATLYQVSWDDQEGFLRFNKNPVDGDLIVNEVKALKLLQKSNTHFYFPTLVDAFQHQDQNLGTIRQAVVYQQPHNLLSLQKVRNKLPLGLDPRDWAWIFRRILLALDTVHSFGLLYLSSLPDNVLIHPQQHGLVFTNWTNSVPVGLVTPYKVLAHENFYPQEVTKKLPATPSTDLYMVAKLSNYMLNERRTPLPMQTFFKGVTLTSTASRPQSAMSLLQEFDQLLERLYGHRKFRPFPLQN